MNETARKSANSKRKSAMEQNEMGWQRGEE